MVGYWKTIRKQAAKETFELVRLDQPGRILLWMFLLIAAGVSAMRDWAAAANRVLTVVGATAIGGLLIFAAKLIRIPVRQAKDKDDEIAALKARIVEMEMAESAAANSPPGDAIPSPDWLIKDLLFFMCPDLLDDGDDSRGRWLAAEEAVLDAASIGRLAIWGRPFDESGMSLMLLEVRAPVEPIPKEYWRDATLAHNFYGDEQSGKLAATQPRLRSKGIRP